MNPDSIFRFNYSNDGFLYSLDCEFMNQKISFYDADRDLFINQITTFLNGFIFLADEFLTYFPDFDNFHSQNECEH